MTEFLADVLTGISDLELVFGFHSSHVVMCVQTHLSGAEGDAVGFAKTFPDIPCCVTSHGGFSQELHEDPDFVPTMFHEEVVDLVDVVRLLDQHDKFVLFETR